MSSSVPSTLTDHNGPTGGGGGYSSPTTTLGDMIRNDGGGNESDDRLPVGSNGQVLTVVSGEPEWADLDDSGGAGGATEVYARRAPHYPPFTLGSMGVEFTGSDLASFTLVEDSSPVLVRTETHDVLSIKHPGGDSTGELHAHMKTPVSIAANDYVEICWCSAGRGSNFVVVGLIMSDGTTYGAGTQCVLQYSSANNFELRGFTNFNTAGTNNSFSFFAASPTGNMFLRFYYLGSNTWRGYASSDRISWSRVTSDVSFTLTPTHFGFHVSRWGAASGEEHTFTFRYWDHGSGLP